MKIITTIKGQEKCLDSDKIADSIGNGVKKSSETLKKGAKKVKNSFIYKLHSFGSVDEDYLAEKRAEHQRKEEISQAKQQLKELKASQ